MGIIQKALLQTEGRWGAQGNIVVQLFELQGELAAFFVEHRLLQTDYSDLYTLQILSRKWTKYVCHFKENNELRCQC